MCTSLFLRILEYYKKACTCAPAVVTEYQKRISGPLLDRIDIHIEVPRVAYEKLSGDRLGESRDIQKSVFRQRFIGHCLQRRNACWGNAAVLQVAGQVSEFDAGGDESTQFVGTRLSSHPQVGTHDCGSAESDDIQSHIWQRHCNLIQLLMMG